MNKVNARITSSKQASDRQAHEVSDRKVNTVNNRKAHKVGDRKVNTVNAVKRTK